MNPDLNIKTRMEIAKSTFKGVLFSYLENFEKQHGRDLRWRTTCLDNVRD